MSDKQQIDLPKAVMIAGALIAIAIYFNGEPRYSITLAGGEGTGVYRLDRYTGDVSLCAGLQCYPAKENR